MIDTDACSRYPRDLWGFIGVTAFLFAISGDLVAETSEIDSYDRAVTSQTKEDAIAFLRDFGSSHLVGDLIESLRPEVAHQVCTEVPAAISKARQACEQIEARPSVEVTEDVPAVAPVATPVAEEPGDRVSLEEQTDMGTTPRAVDSGMEQRRAAASMVRVQLLSTKSRSGTERDWRRLQTAYPDLLGTFDIEIAQVNLGPSKGIWYRGLAGPVASRDEASALCRNFRAQDTRNQCIVAGNE
jgi:hypothetical protein